MMVGQSSVVHNSDSGKEMSMPAHPHLPGPRGHFLTGHLPEFRRDVLGFVTRCAREYGDLVAFRLGPRRCVLVNHPDLIEEVLVKQNHRLIKHFALRINPIVLGKGLVTSERDFWLRQRRLVQPAFHRQRVAAYSADMVAYTERLVATWQDDETRDLHADMMRLTLEIVAKTLFDADVAEDAPDVGDALETVLTCFKRQFGSLFPLMPVSVPIPRNLRLRRAVRQLDAILYRFIAQRRAGGNDRGDLLSLLLHARDEDDGQGMTDQQLRDEMMTLFLAGHETTALTLAWTWYLLAQHPEVEARLSAELQDVLSGRAPTVDDSPRLRYTEQVITESMRLYSPIYVFGREVAEPCPIGGHTMPVGWTLFLSQWVTHRDPRFFSDPAEFRPERWSDPAIKALPKYAFFPFGGGPRVCIGNGFAMMEAVLILATIARHWRFTMDPSYTVTPRPIGTLRPHPGVRGQVHRRGPSVHSARVLASAGEEV
jgi:cytochrome P450